jgi:hypothetical protein
MLIGHKHIQGMLYDDFTNGSPVALCGYRMSETRHNSRLIKLTPNLNKQFIMFTFIVLKSGVTNVNSSLHTFLCLFTQFVTVILICTV